MDQAPQDRGTKHEIWAEGKSTAPVSDAKPQEARRQEAKPQEQKPQDTAKAAPKDQSIRDAPKPKAEGTPASDSPKLGTEPSRDQAGSKAKNPSRSPEGSKSNAQQSTARAADRLVSDRTPPGHHLRSPLGRMDQAPQDRGTKHEIWKEDTAAATEARLPNAKPEVAAKEAQKSQQAKPHETSRARDGGPTTDVARPTPEGKAFADLTHRSQDRRSDRLGDPAAGKAKEPIGGGSQDANQGGAGPGPGSGGTEGAGAGVDPEVFERKDEAKRRAELAEEIARLEDKIGSPIYKRIETADGHGYVIDRDKLRAVGVPERTIQSLDKLARDLRMVPKGEGVHLWYGQVEPGLPWIRGVGTDAQGDASLAEAKDELREERYQTAKEALSSRGAGAVAAAKPRGRPAGRATPARRGRPQQTRESQGVQRKPQDKKQGGDSSAAPPTAAPDRSKADVPKPAPAPKLDTAQPNKPTIVKDLEKSTDQPKVEKPEVPKVGKTVTEPKSAELVGGKTLEERLAPLEKRRAENQEAINQKKIELGRKGGEVGRLSGKGEEQAGELKSATAERNRLQDELNRLGTKDAELKKLIDFIRNPPPENPQKAGRTFESRNVKFTGMPKNGQKFATSFPGRDAPDGKRIPDHVVKSDKQGNWVTASKPSEAEFIAESKLLEKNIGITQQLRGFVELAAKTEFKVLVLLTDRGATILPSVYEFASDYGVIVSQMTRDPRL